LYPGEFLHGFSLPDWSAELEEWVLSTQEFLAARVRGTFIRAAERFALSNLGALEWLSGDLQTGKDMLEEALRVGQDLPALHLICRAQSNLSGVMQDLGDLASTRVLARSVLEFLWKQHNT
jgi:hypothetical protein